MRKDTLYFYRVGRLRKDVIGDMEISILRFITPGDATRWVVEDHKRKKKESPRFHSKILSSPPSRGIEKIWKELGEGGYVIFKDRVTVVIYEN